MLTDGTSAPQLAERLRMLIAGHQFRLTGGAEVRLTASFGVVRSPLHGTTGIDLIWAAGEALWWAKQTRDAVHVAEKPIAVAPRSVQVTVDQQLMLADLAERLGRSVDSLVHEAMQLLLENHAPRWHWIVELRGPTAGEPRDPIARAAGR